MGLPVIGESIDFVRDTQKFFITRRAKYGGIFKTHILGRPTIFVSGADNIRTVLLGEYNLVTFKWPKTLHKILGDFAIAMSSGDQHRWRRRQTMEFFKTENIVQNGYVDRIQNFVQEKLDSWCKSSMGGKNIIVYTECKEMMFRIAGNVLLGFDFTDNEATYLTGIFQDVVDHSLSYPVYFPGSGLWKALKARDIIAEKITKRIRQKIKSRKSGDEPNHYDVLSFMMDKTKPNGEKFTEEEMKMAAFELLFAAHENPASAACSLIRFLGTHPDVLRKLRQELQANNLLDSCNQLNYHTVQRMPYVEQIVKETLRLAPPITGGFRKALKPFNVGGYRIPKGWTVLYSIKDTHMNADIFTDKRQFDPERFNEQRAEDKKNRSHYLPFGGGPRTCAGQSFALISLKILTICLARSCSWEIQNPGNIKIKQLPVPHPRCGMPSKFTAQSFNISSETY
ncbi:cytochrome P450 26A1-like [Anneissia japonica]|uniref:cytochrome P450 26A1-like n=1 Tax=Anneissia japonica TaxID=1529436 RepID=UPI001425A0E7|nr:cytochrome P450 26A1-like [Anneissia japonica]